MSVRSLSSPVASRTLRPAAKSRRNLLRRFLSHRMASAGALAVVIFILAAAFAPLLTPYGFEQTNWSALKQPPSAQYPLGTDDLGRDLLTRILYGARTSLQAGVISVSIALALGVPIGLLSGYYRGRLDEVVQRITDALLAFPFLILAIALAGALGPSLKNAMAAIGIATAPTFVRLTRGPVLTVREEEYVQAARAAGASDLRIILRHVLPNSLAPLLVQSSLAIAAAITAEATLSFLGLGAQPPIPSWGSMLFTAQRFLRQAPWLALWPGIAIFVTVLAFNVLGDGIRDVLDPKER